MSYVVFARKYRPQDFDGVVGQEIITTTLKNAIKSGRIAHAYLFTGPRGIGKTSTARIFAKSLNCKTGPTVSACGECTSCIEITAGTSLDVIEIDGASNRGIDEIRELRENVKFAAINGKFKIYIIDEVHMLTQEAFNALLKTLEEPPMHVKFIFATTQPHKVPSTILSRCQRFDFRRISTNKIIEKLKEIAKAETLNVSDEALLTITRASEGCLRDAETILDQLSSFNAGSIDKSDVSLALGMIERDTFFAASDCIANKDSAGALKLINHLVSEGKDLDQFIFNLIEHMRNILVSKISKDIENIIDLPAQAVKRIIDQNQNFSVEDLLYIIYLLMNTQLMMKRSESRRIALEVALIKLTTRASVMALDEVLNKISELEKKTINSANLADTALLKTPPPTVMPKTPEIPSEEANLENATNTNTATLEEDKINDVWLNLLKIMRNKKISLASYLLEGKIDSVDADTFIIGFPKNFLFHKETLERLENRNLIEEGFKEILKRDVRVKFTTLSHSKEYNIKPEESMSSLPTGEEIKEPIVQSAIQIFKGRVVKSA